MAQGAHCGVGRQQVRHLHRQHPGGQRGAHAGGRILQHQALRRGHAQPLRGQQIDIRRGLGRGHVAAGADRVEAVEQAGAAQFAQRQRTPGGGGDRARQRLTVEPVEQRDDARPVRHAGVHHLLVQAVGMREQRLGGLPAQARGEDRAAGLLAGADQFQPLRWRNLVAGRRRGAGHAVADRAFAVEHQPVHVEHHRRRREGQRRRLAHAVCPNSCARSASSSGRHWPGARPPRSRPPTRVRCRAWTWLPTAANMRRTWW